MTIATGALSRRSGYTTNDLMGVPLLPLMSTHSLLRGDDLSADASCSAAIGLGSPGGGRFGLRGPVVAARAAGARCSNACPARGSTAAGTVWGETRAPPDTHA